MDASQKEQNRSKWKASARRGRGRGRGRGAGGPSSRAAHGPDLDSNYDRYIASDEEGGSVDAGDGLPVRQSQGADLQQLLAESEQFYGQAHFRYRSFIEVVDTKPPLVDVAAFEEELVIQPGPLIQALSKIPLNELLGLSVPAEFLQEGSWDDPPKVIIDKTDLQQHVADAAASLASLQVQPPPQQQQQQARLPPHLQQQQVRQQLQPRAEQQQQQQQQQQQPAQSAGQVSQPTATTAAAAAGCVQQPPAPAPAAAAAAATSGCCGAPAAAAASKGDDDTDELLELLLSGGAPPPVPQPAAPAAAPAATVAAAPAQGARGSAANPFTPAAKPVPPAAATAAAAPKASAAVLDDDLDALLGLGPSAGAAARQVPAQGTQAPGVSGSKKQSLEDWLDGF